MTNDAPLEVYSISAWDKRDFRDDYDWKNTKFSQAKLRQRSANSEFWQAMLFTSRWHDCLLSTQVPQDGKPSLILRFDSITTKLSTIEMHVNARF